MLKPRELVIARYNEDISWSGKYKTIRTIYNKGEDISGIDTVPLPNVGRETHTYLYHIIHNWDNLAEKTMFCQGGMIGHRLEISDVEAFFEAPGLFKANDFYREYNWGYINHIWKWAEEKSSGQMKKAEMPFGEWFDRIIGIPRSEYFLFVPGANFCVHRDAVKSRSLEFYKHLIKRVDDHINPEEAHYFERAWIYIFNIPTP